MPGAGTALQLDEENSNQVEKPRLFALECNNIPSNEGLSTKSELTEQPQTVVTSAEEKTTEIEEISSTIIADKFRDFLISQKGISEDHANDVSSHLEEFIEQHVPEIAAIQTLRDKLKTEYSLPKERYTDARKADPELTPMKWFNEHYRDAAGAGVVSAGSINEHDGGFFSAFKRAYAGQRTLGDEIFAAKVNKREACKVLFGADEVAIAKFLEVMPTSGFLSR